MIEIGEAVAAWDAGEHAAAFEAVCRLWAETTDARVGELCEAISEQLVRERVAALEHEVGRERVLGELNRAARAGERVAVHALLPWLIALERPKDRQKLIMLDVPDPVLLRWVMLWHRRRPELNELSGYLQRQWRTWVVGLHLWWERKEPPDFDRTPRYARSLLRMSMVQTRPREPRAVTSVELGAIETLRERVETTQAPERARARALLDAVIDDPDDDGRRAVLSDYLLAHDHEDPRGELIALQLRAAARSSSDSARERERELLDIHGFRWLGPLALHSNPASVRFERGFLVGLDLRFGSDRFPEMQAPGDPIWATVEQVNGASWAVVGHPIMRSLRELGCDRECAGELLRGPVRPKLERLTITWYPPHTYSEQQVSRLRPEHAAALLDTLDAVPNLRHLGIRDPLDGQPRTWRWLWQGPRARLTSLRLRTDRSSQAPGLAEWIALLHEDRPDLELRLDHVFLLFELHPRAAPRTLRVTHNVPRWRSYDMNGSFRILVGVLAATLRAGVLDRVELDPRVAEPQPLIAKLRERGLDPAIEIVASPVRLAE